jgi:hypothetical protein
MKKQMDKNIIILALETLLEQLTDVHSSDRTPELIDMANRVEQQLNKLK